MHEISVVNNIIKILEKVCEENKAKKVLKINLKINPYSCLDEENLNFIFSMLVKEREIFKDAKINVIRGNIHEREYIIENIEIEV
ncbi:MAG: hydrogenase/urease maturation nickel metallochaperone HypA [Candidatus Omnitrophica bacterium]|nr:hydrogenase/urease maturation nickel metallochaperone HypA [Candidatus Omnitrophota bacterium]MCM8807133.1 hydrogenase/urease maturation nickel metallochaperone HypA [Candidatus Omnitrophota bacterium]